MGRSEMIITPEVEKVYEGLAKDLRVKAALAHYAGKLSIELNSTEFTALFFNDELVGYRSEKEVTFYFLGLEVKKTGKTH